MSYRGPAESDGELESRECAMIMMMMIILDFEDNISLFLTNALKTADI